MTRIGIEIGGTKQQIIAGDNQGNIVDRCRFGMEPNANASDIQKRITEELPKLITAHQPERIGVGFGGPVDITQGKVATSYQIEGWSGFPLRDWLHDLSGLPVVIEMMPTRPPWLKRCAEQAVASTPPFT